MLQQRVEKPKIGDCESCTTTNTEVWRMYGNMWLCIDCRTKELDITSKQASVRSTLDQFRQTTEHINLQTDIHNANTVEILALRSSVYADDTIPDDQKEQRFTDLMLEQYLKFKAAVKATQELLTQQQNAMKAFQVNGQEAAGRLSAELQAKYREFNVNYNPQPVKSIKTAAVERGPKAAKSRTQVIRYKDVKAALERAGIMNASSSVMSNILFVVQNKKKTIEEVVADYVKSLNLN